MAEGGGGTGSGAQPAESTPAESTPAESTPAESTPAADPYAPVEELALDAPPPGLPELTFPSSEDREFKEWASEKRRRRIRIEMYGSAGILVVGVLASVLTQTAAFLILCLMGVGGMLAYEFLVNSLE